MCEGGVGVFAENVQTVCMKPSFVNVAFSSSLHYYDGFLRIRTSSAKFLCRPKTSG